MTFGPDVHVARTVPAPGRVSSVRLGAYTAADADRLFPFEADDPALAHLGPYEPASLVTDTGQSYLDRWAEDPDIINWGVWAGDELAGYTSLTHLERWGRGIVGFGVLLGARYRRRGIGSLATAGTLAAALTPGLVARHVDEFDGEVSQVATFIHPKNRPSHVMCKQFGFALVRKFLVPNRTGVPYPWVYYELPAPGTESRNLVPSRVRHAERTRQQAMGRYEISLG